MRNTRTSHLFLLLLFIVTASVATAAANEGDTVSIAALYDLGGLAAFRKAARQASMRRLWMAAIVPQAAVNIGFTFSFVHTTAAHALLLINVNPLWCAVLGRVWLGDALPWHTVAALWLAMSKSLDTIAALTDSALFMARSSVYKFLAKTINPIEDAVETSYRQSK